MKNREPTMKHDEYKGKNKKNNENQRKTNET